MNKIIGLVFAILLSNQTQAGDATIGQSKTAVCTACHAIDGNSVLSANPKLAGQSEQYLVKQLKDYKSETRKNPIMLGMAKMLSDEDVENVAAYYASQKIQHTAIANKHAEQIEIAQKIYRGGDSNREIPACIACHGAKGNGIATAGFPAIGGQHPEYTIATLKAFRSGTRNNDLNNVMRDVVAKMSDTQIEALGYYLAGLH